jgi:two-component sensor histidine kinase
MCSYYEVSYGLDNRNIAMTCEVDSPNLHIDQLVPVGLILNELLINSMKHAFDEKGGNITIGCHYAAELIIFTVRDNGRGLPPGYQQNMKNSLGLQLVQGLTKQLKGVLEIKNQGGAVFELRFKPRFK